MKKSLATKYGIWLPLKVWPKLDGCAIIPEIYKGKLDPNLDNHKESTDAT